MNKTDTNTKKPKEVEKEIKAALIETIEGVFVQKDEPSLKKLKKVIRHKASEIAKKYIKSVKKNQKKALKEAKITQKKEAKAKAKTAEN